MISRSLLLDAGLAWAIVEDMHLGRTPSWEVKKNVLVITSYTNFPSSKALPGLVSLNLHPKHDLEVRYELLEKVSQSWLEAIGRCSYAAILVLSPFRNRRANLEASVLTPESILKALLNLSHIIGDVCRLDLALCTGFFRPDGRILYRMEESLDLVNRHLKALEVAGDLAHENALNVLPRLQADLFGGHETRTHDLVPEFPST